jgi:putative ABC transport system permease protein
MTLGVRYGINVAHISYTPPNSASATPLLVDVDFRRTMFTLVLMMVVGTLAAYLPARRAAKQAIIDALGHV